jgi:hypothetical protein
MFGDEHTEIGWFTVEEACTLEGLALAVYPALFRRLEVAIMCHDRENLTRISKMSIRGFPHPRNAIAAAGMLNIACSITPNQKPKLRSSSRQAR